MNFYSILQYVIKLLTMENKSIFIENSIKIKFHP
jgi:hypothetical protein